MAMASVNEVIPAAATCLLPSPLGMSSSSRAALRCLPAVTNTPSAVRLVADILGHAKAAGANCVAVACPLCQTNLECYQSEVNHAYGTDYAMPILYFTQLLGLALGVGVKRLGIGKELVSAQAIIRRPTGAVTPTGS